MKLIIQIPCFNEAATLPNVIADLPELLPGVDEIEYLVIDDGSTDGTADLARSLGVKHVLEMGSNRGLATAFLAGVRYAVDLGADIIVNTDGDNQYAASSISDLIAPVVAGQADVVVGARPIEDIDHFSWLKKRLQRWGSNLVRQLSGTAVADTTSGFRAYTAEAAMRLHVFNRYTYTLETIIQAGALHMRIIDVPIKVNPKTRESRLISSLPRYVWRSAATIIRSYVTYRPLRTFIYLAIPPGLAGMALGLRFLYFFISRQGAAGHVQSLILAAILVLISFHLAVLGVIADLVGVNRRLLQDTLYLQRRVLRRQSRESAGAPAGKPHSYPS